MMRTDCINSGIYKITCLTTDKFYIGSAVNINRRFDEHKTLLRHNKHYNSKLQNAWNKYGEENFYFGPIEFVEESQLLDIEQWWIDSTNVCKVGFNLAQKAGAGGSCKEWIVTYPDGKEETITNMAKFARLHNLNTASLSQVALGKLNHYKQFTIRKSHQSLEDWKKTLTRSTKFGHGWKGQYIITTPNGEELVIDSLNEFCVKHKLNQGNMASICRGERKQHKGYTVRFLTLPQEDT